MRAIILFLTVFTSHFSTHAQDIELDHTAPKIVVNGSSNKIVEFGSFGQNGNEINLYSLGGTKSAVLSAGDGQNTTGILKLTNQNGSETIRLFGNYGQSSKGRVVTSELEITGGSDLAEHFDITTSTEEEVLPGHLVSLDENESGKLILTNKKYDKNIVGIVSGANGVGTGMIMRQRESIADGDYPVALVGRTYVRANTENGNIQIGDLLTSSSTEGEVMKVKKHRKAYGAIVGKAMSALTDEKGYVLVLINLN